MCDSSSGTSFVNSFFLPAESATTEQSASLSAITIANIIGLVNKSVATVSRRWGLSPDEIADLKQDGYLAAIAADMAYDATKAPWAVWVRRRVHGQLKTSIARLRGYGITGHHANIYPLSLDDFTPEGRSVDNDDEDVAEPLLQIVSGVSQTTESQAETDSSLEILEQCLDSSQIRILRAHYGFDGPALTVSQLAQRLGYSRKHAFTLLQRAQDSARSCLGVGLGPQGRTEGCTKIADSGLTI